MSRKPRSDSKLKTLPPAVQEAIIARLDAQDGQSDSSIKACVAWLKAECLVESSAGALSHFYSWFKLRARMEARERQSVDLQDALRKRKLGLSEEEIISIGNKHFIEQGVASGDAKLFALILDRVLAKRSNESSAKLKTRQLDIQERRVVLLEVKAKQADAAKEVINSALSPEEQRIRLKEILK